MGCMPPDGISDYIDKRNWVEYNEGLVRRGELYLSLDFLDHWDEEIESTNEGKRGRPYAYPWSMFEFLGYVHSLLMPFRQIQGFLGKLSQFVPQLEVPDYTTIWWRVSRMDIPAPNMDSEEPIVIAIDSSGVKVTNKGEWMRKKWRGGEYKGWIKVHVAVDVRSKKVMAMEMTDERTADYTAVPSLIDQIEDNGGKVKRVLADGAYYNTQTYNLLEEKGIDAGIRMRKDARTRARGSPYRARCVREFKSMGYERWREEKDYGKRWSAEALFSSFKSIFGEYGVARRTDLMYKEVKMKLVLYNLLLNVK